MSSPERIEKAPVPHRPRAVRPRTRFDEVEDAVLRIVDGDEKTKKRDPHFTNMGGENLVFEFRDKKEKQIVYKVNYLGSAQILRAELGRDWGEAFAEEQILRRTVEERTASLLRLRETMGRDTVPPFRNYVEDMPLTPEMGRVLFPNPFGDTAVYPDRDFPERIPVWVTVQRRMEDMEGERVCVLSSFGYPEMNGGMGFRVDDVLKLGLAERRSAFERRRLMYAHGHSLLVGDPAYAKLPYERQIKIVHRMFPFLGNVIERSESDSSFRRSLASCVKKMVEYEQRLDGEMFDFVGRNILMLQKREGWKICFLDPFAPRRNRIEDAVQTAMQLKRGGRVAFNGAIRSMNALNTIRILNALALISGVPRKAWLTVPEIGDIPAEVWDDVIQKNLGPRAAVRQMEMEGV